MAQEITIAAMSLRVDNGTFKNGYSTTDLPQQRVDQTTAGGTGDVQNIGTSEELIGYTGQVAGLTNEGWAIFRNLGSTNYVEIGPYSGGTFYPCIRLDAGEHCAVRLAQATTLYARANTAAVELEWYIYED